MENRLGKLSMDAFTLRIIAIVSMALSHMVEVFWTVLPYWLIVPLEALRQMAFPIMAFFLTEGFRRTSNIKGYMLRLLVFASVSQIPYLLAFSFWGFGFPLLPLNIIFTMLLGLVCMTLHDKLYLRERKRAIFVVVFIPLLIIGGFFVEGNYFTLLLIFLFYAIKDEKKRRTIPLVVSGVLINLDQIFAVLALVMPDLTGNLFVPRDLAGLTGFELLLAGNYVFTIGTFLVIPLLRAYSGERGRSAKYLFYAFYPLHLSVLAAVAFALGLNAFPFPYS